ncbi:hypothetical protein I8752_35775 [Nostocaceae cyanobacterium CENA369]|uniref:Uncharacterized protein n=1 Tax=Dendronalium phyllosphericum CENA369 TaxID=1725256 RepID=A0A8J7IIK2_9NOST|nr:hypothetical protein [Dendronalium phyllosphericum]MBH8578213.1 hypothetical protein [Dendronalium phyllosphericum CENA369]
MSEVANIFWLQRARRWLKFQGCGICWDKERSHYLAGVPEVPDFFGQLRPTISHSYGYTTIIAAFIGRLKAIFIHVGGE